MMALHVHLIAQTDSRSYGFSLNHRSFVKCHTAQIIARITLYSLSTAANPLLLSHGGNIPLTGLFLAA